MGGRVSIPSDAYLGTLLLTSLRISRELLEGSAPFAVIARANCCDLVCSGAVSFLSNFLLSLVLTILVEKC